MAQEFVGAPVFCEFHCRASQIAVILLQLRLEAAEQRESVRGRAGKPRQNLVLVKPPDLLGGVLNHRIAKSYLPVPRQNDLAIAAYRQDRCRAYQSLFRHESKLLL